MKTLTLQGMGWKDGDHSKASNVGNCRVRGELENKNGRTIFVEFMGFLPGSSSTKQQKSFKVYGILNSCFYTDNEHDKSMSHSKDLRHLENSYFEYSLENILTVINECFGCDYQNINIQN